MDKLPPELLLPILHALPRSSLSTCRLVCRAFNTLAFPILFSHVMQWLDYEASHRKIIALAQDAYNRPSVMWSPFASEPDGELEDVWLSIVFKMLCGKYTPTLSLGRVVEMNPHSGGEVVTLTGDNFAVLSGKDDLTARKLRTAQNRYLLHRGYVEGKVDDKSPGGKMP